MIVAPGVTRCSIFKSIIYPCNLVKDSAFKVQIFKSFAKFGVKMSGVSSIILLTSTTTQMWWIGARFL